MELKLNEMNQIMQEKEGDKLSKKERDQLDEAW